ncbi:hypothetical protein LPB41_03750 [Thalassospira sp. MA62]|nr:hypothetical protein [Thalassospira sp. MA62]
MMHFPNLVSVLRRGFLFAVIATLAACSQKAETLKVSVIQFGTAAQTAFDDYDAAHAAQFIPPEKSPDQQRRAFVTNMGAFTGTVSPQNIGILIDPDAASQAAPADTHKWRDTLDHLRKQYQTFAAIFDNIEGGSALGASAVTKSGPILKQLRDQLRTIAADLGKNPPIFLRRRAILIAKLNEIRQHKNADQQVKSLKYQMWWQDWQKLRALETDMQTKTLRSFVHANLLGARLQTQIDQYAKLDAAALLKAVKQGIALSGSINAMSPKDLINQGIGLGETATN